MSILLPQHLTRAMHVYTEHSKSAVGDVVMVWGLLSTQDSIFIFPAW